MSPSRLRALRAVALDVDGVLTDGAFWWGPGGEEWKRFHFADVMGLALAGKAGLILTLISGEATPQVDRYASKMGIRDVFAGCKDKAAAFREFAKRRTLDLNEIAFMGDDVNDLPALRIAGVAAAPANARPEVLEMADFVSSREGGNGAVRDFIDAILAAKADAGAGTN